MVPADKRVPTSETRARATSYLRPGYAGACGGLPFRNAVTASRLRIARSSPSLRKHEKMLAQRVMQKRRIKTAARIDEAAFSRYFYVIHAV